MGFGDKMFELIHHFTLLHTTPGKTDFCNWATPGGEACKTHKRRYKKGDSMIYLNDPSLEGTQNIPIDNKDVMDCLADADHVYVGKLGATITWPAFNWVPPDCGETSWHRMQRGRCCCICCCTQ